MKLIARSLIILFLFIFSAIYFTPVVYGATTSFRSANIITADGSSSYTNLTNCSSTDGNTCDRAASVGYGNLYFRDFGTYSDFGIPSGSTITRISVRVTGKATASTYAGLSDGQTFSSNCQWQSDLWNLFELNGNTINTQTVAANLTEKSYVPGTVLAYCLQPDKFASKNFIFRINYSSSAEWSANIDNFEIAFDYEASAAPSLTPAPTPTPTLTLTPAPILALMLTPSPASTSNPASSDTVRHLASPTPTPTPIPKTPLILIPGIGGSELKTAEMRIWSEPNGHGGTFTHVYPEEKVWVNSIEAGKPGDDDYFDILRMKEDGTTSEANLALTGNLFELYNGTIDFFVSNGYTLYKDLFVFPYDWRKDINSTTPLLDQKIDSIKKINIKRKSRYYWSFNGRIGCEKLYC